jgi:hypothetical protein
LSKSDSADWPRAHLVPGASPSRVIGASAAPLSSPRCGCCCCCHTVQWSHAIPGTSRHTHPTAGGTATTKAHTASGSGSADNADKAPIEPEHQRATAAPNTVQRIGPCSAIPQTGRGLPSEWRQRRRDRRARVGRSCGKVRKKKNKEKTLFDIFCVTFFVP